MSYKTPPHINTFDMDLSETPTMKKVEDGFMETIKEMTNMCYKQLMDHFQSQVNIPSIYILLIPSISIFKDAPIVSKQYQNNRFVRLFRYEIRIKGVKLNLESIKWS